MWVRPKDRVNLHQAIQKEVHIKKQFLKGKARPHLYFPLIKSVN